MPTPATIRVCRSSRGHGRFDRGRTPQLERNATPAPLVTMAAISGSSGTRRARASRTSPTPEVWRAAVDRDGVDVFLDRVDVTENFFAIERTVRLRIGESGPPTTRRNCGSRAVLAARLRSARNFSTSELGRGRRAGRPWRRRHSCSGRRARRKHDRPPDGISRRRFPFQ